MLDVRVVKSYHEELEISCENVTVRVVTNLL